jgi:hypothetical protein
MRALLPGTTDKPYSVLEEGSAMSPPEIMDRLKRHGVDPNDVFNANGDLLENDK